jgi:hypothetical protein
MGRKNCLTNLELVPHVTPRSTSGSPTFWMSRDHAHACFSMGELREVASVWDTFLPSQQSR